MLTPFSSLSFLPPTPPNVDWLRASPLIVPYSSLLDFQNVVDQQRVYVAYTEALAQKYRHNRWYWKAHESWQAARHNQESLRQHWTAMVGCCTTEGMG